VRNGAFRVPGEAQSNQIGEVVAIIKATSTAQNFIPLVIASDSMYAINGLTDQLSTWEDNGWISIKNAQFFKAAAAILKQCLASTSFKWIKGHNGTQGNEEADKLAKEGAEKPTPDPLDLSIPKEFDLQGAKLATILQATAHKGINERKPPLLRRTTLTNIQLTRDALATFNNIQETDETIWNSLKNTSIRLNIRQFMYKSMHGTQKIGHYWTHINGYEERQNCPTCESTETMEHILIHCHSPTPNAIWTLTH
jgi:ribonuclease HI